MSSTVRRSIRRRTYLPVAVGFAAVALLPPATSAAAAAPTAARADTCARVVVDGADVLGRATAVTKAAAALAREGATVRVRTYDEVPDGDVDAAVAAEVTRCTGWQDADGGRRPDLLVLAVSVGDRRIATSYGSRWSQALDPVWEGVQSTTMAPLLREEDHAGALAAGLDELRAAVAEPVPSTDPDAGSDAGSDAGPDAGSGDGSYGGGMAGGEPYGSGSPFADTQPGGEFGAASDGFVIVLIFGAVAVVIAIVSALSGRGGGGGSSPSSGSSRSWSSRRHGSPFGSDPYSPGSSTFGSSSGSSFGSSSGSGSDSSSGSSGSSASDGGGGGSSSY